jgi:hypothetical protein
MCVLAISLLHVWLCGSNGVVSYDGRAWLVGLVDVREAGIDIRVCSKGSRSCLSPSPGSQGFCIQTIALSIAATLDLRAVYDAGDHSLITSHREDPVSVSGHCCVVSRSAGPSKDTLTGSEYAPSFTALIGQGLGSVCFDLCLPPLDSTSSAAKELARMVLWHPVALFDWRIT